MLRFVDAPCKDCADRHTGCHDKCKLYSEYKEKLNLYNKKVAEEQRLDHVIMMFDKRRRRR